MPELGGVQRAVGGGTLDPSKHRAAQERRAQHRPERPEQDLQAQMHQHQAELVFADARELEQQRVQQQQVLREQQQVPSLTEQLRRNGGGDGDACALCLCAACVSDPGSDPRPPPHGEAPSMEEWLSKPSSTAMQSLIMPNVTPRLLIVPNRYTKLAGRERWVPRTRYCTVLSCTTTALHS